VGAGNAARAGRREWIGLAVLALPCLLYSMDLTVLYLALPKLSAALHPTSTPSSSGGGRSFSPRCL